MNKNEDFVSIPEASKLLGVCTATMRKWCEEGKILAWRPGHRSQWRIYKKGVAEMLYRYTGY